MKYKVYQISSRCSYSGYALIAAENADEANAFIKDFQKRDKDNQMNSWGYDKVEESDIFYGIWAEEKGFIHYGIYYIG